MKVNFATVNINAVQEGVTGLFSVAGFFVLRGLYYVQAYPYLFTGLSCALIILSGFCMHSGFLIKKNRAKCLFIGASVFFVLSLVYGSISKVNGFKYQESSLLANETFCLSEAYSASVRDNPKEYAWMADAILEDQIIYLRVPSSISHLSFEKNIADPKKKDSWGSDRSSYAFFSGYSINEEPCQGEYTVAAVYKPILKKGETFKRCSPLDVSVNHVMKGVALTLKHRYDEGFEELETADSMGNATGTYLLSKWYKRGYGRDSRNEEKAADSLMAEAAKKGSRIACYELGRDILERPKSTATERAKAEQYLINAVTLQETVSRYDRLLSYYAVKTLDSYYIETKRYKNAYNLTKKGGGQIVEPDIRYKLHLDNCLRCGKYDEAAEIVRDGESKKFRYTYLIHAKMLSEGIGMEQDVKEAERMYRTFADSLEMPLAYQGLSELYRKLGVPNEDVSFLSSLSELNFSHSIK